MSIVILYKVTHRIYDDIEIQNKFNILFLLLCYFVILNIIKHLFTVAFKMYDLDNDDLISKDELLAILHMMVGANIR